MRIMGHSGPDLLVTGPSDQDHFRGATKKVDASAATAAVTDLARYRAMRQRPVTDFFRWHEAAQTIALTSVRIWFAVQRDIMRVFLR